MSNDHVFVECVDSSSAARTHSAQQIFTLTGGTHETPDLNDHQADDIIQYTMMEQNNEWMLVFY